MKKPVAATVARTAEMSWLRDFVRVKPNMERDRRDWVERHEYFRDDEEEFVRRKEAATTTAEERRLDEWFSPRRKAQRETDVALGKRSAGMGVAMRQIMWARWLDIAVDHELVARQAFNELVTRRHSDPLGREFLASLVAMTASAHALEAVYGDIKYLIPAQRKLGRRYKDLLHALQVAFGVSQTDYEGLAFEFAWLFPVRDLAVHPYTETLPTKPHPIPGVNSDVLHSNFNAVQSGRAVDIVMASLTFAESPPHPYDEFPHGHWISRWSADRQPYFAQAHDLQSQRDASPLIVP